MGHRCRRWQARAALARAERDVPDQRADPDRHAAEAADIIDGVVKGLTPGQAHAYLAARPVVEGLDLAR